MLDLPYTKPGSWDWATVYGPHAKCQLIDIITVIYKMYSQMQNFILTYAKNLRGSWCLDHFQNINICSKLFSTRFELGSQNNVTYLLSLKFLWTVQLLSNFNCIREALYLERRLNIQASLHDFNERTNGNSYLSYAKRDTNKWSRVLLSLALT